MKSGLIITLALSATILGGCADLMSRSTVAPEWFEARAAEVKGEGYPKLTDVPTAEPFGTDESWDNETSQLEREAADMEARAAESVIPTPEEIRAAAAQLRAQTSRED